MILLSKRMNQLEKNGYKIPMYSSAAKKYERKSKTKRGVAGAQLIFIGFLKYFFFNKTIFLEHKMTLNN